MCRWLRPPEAYSALVNVALAEHLVAQLFAHSFEHHRQGEFAFDERHNFVLAKTRKAIKLLSQSSAS